MAKHKLVSQQVARPAPSNLLRSLTEKQQPFRKEGEHSISLAPIGPPAADGSIEMGLDMTSAPIPSRRYAAELCSVSNVDFEARFVFAQRVVAGDGTDTAVVIRLNPHSLSNFADSIRRMESPTLDEAKAMMGLPDESLSVITDIRGQTVNMVASVVAIAYAGFDTCIDFYHASAFATRKSEMTGTLDVEPVVRIELRTSLFIALVGKIMEIDREFHNIFKIREGKK